MKEPKKIPTVVFSFMFLAALIFDIVSFIPFVNIVIAPIAGLTYWLWFRNYGVDFISKKNIKTNGLFVLMELMPGVSILPAWTMSVTFTYVTSPIFKQLHKKYVRKNIRDYVNNPPETPSTGAGAQ